MNFVHTSWAKNHQSFCCSVAHSCPPLCDHRNCSTPGFSVLHYFPELAQTHVHWVSEAIQPSCPLSSPSPPAFNLSQHQGLFNESTLHIRWPKYWNFSIRTSNGYLGLISFRIDWFDLLAVQGTLKSLLNTTVWKFKYEQILLVCGWKSLFYIMALHLYCSPEHTSETWTRKDCFLFNPLELKQKDLQTTISCQSPLLWLGSVSRATMCGSSMAAFWCVSCSLMSDSLWPCGL